MTGDAAIKEDGCNILVKRGRRAGLTLGKDADAADRDRGEHYHAAERCELHKASPATDGVNEIRGMNGLLPEPGPSRDLDLSLFSNLPHMYYTLR